MTFGEALRARREARGLSQRALAAAADVSGAFVSQLENGLRTPSLDVLDRLAAALGTVTSALLAAGSVDGADGPELVHAAVSLREIEELVRDPAGCAQLVAAARELAQGPRGEQFGAYAGVVLEFAELLEAFTTGGYRDVTGAAMVVVTSALSYVVDPDDAWPDAHPHGHLDDVGVLAFTHALVADELSDLRSWRRARRR